MRVASLVSPSAGRHNQQMRIDEILAGGGPVFSFEFFPPKTETGEQNLYAALSELRTLEPAFVSVTYGAGGSSREKTIEIVKRIKEEFGLEAMAHFTCVGATVARAARPRSTRCARPASTTCSRCAATRRRARSDWTKTDGGLEYSRELVELIDGRLPLRDRRGLLPGDAHPRRERGDRPALPRREGAGGRGLPDHADVLRQRLLLRLRHARARGRRRRCRSSRASCRSRASGRSSGWRRCAARRSLRACARSCMRARTTPRRCSTSAWPTPRCSAPSCSPAGAPGIHFYTLNRSPATRAILSALKLARPWEKAVYPGLDLQALGDPRRAVGAS